jgi:hypothetical protein
MRLDHIHPLAVFEEHDFGAGEMEPVANSWGSATVLTLLLAEQGADGPAAENITAMLASAGHPVTDTKKLIRQVLAATNNSQARLRTLQQQLADFVHQSCERATGQEGNR